MTQQEGGIPPYSRWLSLNPRRASPPATMRATQLTDFGTDQSPMMTGHSSKIRTRWSNATTAKITPATRENVFASMSDPPNFIQDNTQGAPANVQRTNWSLGVCVVLASPVPDKLLVAADGVIE